MDKPVSGLVHGGIERCRDLETVVCRSWNWRTLVWRIQNAFVRHMLGLVVVNRKLGDKCIEVRCGSPSAETGRERADGPVTKGASEISNPFQRADYSLFRFLRSQPVGTVVSVRTRGDQHNNCRFLHPVLPTRLAPAYFSKGPAIAFVIRASTAVFGATESGVRFFSPLLAAGTSLLLFYFARRLFSSTAGLWAVVALNVTPIFNIGAFVMTID